MESGVEHIQLVRVIGPFRLVDAESYERAYWRRDGVALVPGYYVVSWPAGADAGSFDENAVFRGPFRQREAAEAQVRQAGTRRQAARIERPRLGR